MDVAVYSTRVMGPAHVHNVADDRLPHRPGPPRRRAHQLPQGHPGDDATEAGVPSGNIRQLHSADNFARARLACRRRTCTAPPTCSTTGKKRGHPGRPRVPRRAPMNSSNSPRSWPAPIIKPLLGKACVPDDSPYTTGGIGLLGTAPVAGGACATATPCSWSAPLSPTWSSTPSRARRSAVQIDVDPTRIGLRYPVDVGLVGDCRTYPASAAAAAERKKDRDFLEKAQERHEGLERAHGRARHARPTSR